MRNYIGHLLLLRTALAFLPQSGKSIRSSFSISSSPSSVEEDAAAARLEAHMNKYNLASLEEISEEWTAVVKPATPFLAEGIYMGVKSKDLNFVDTFQVALPRQPNQGLGLELLELAGGRQDGRGITVVEGLVEGGLAATSNILPGDAISAISIRSPGSETSVSTEALGFDATVQEILSLPPCEAPDVETLVLTMKRIRRKPKVIVTLQYPPGSGDDDIEIELFSGENLRRALLVRGVKLNDPLARRFDSGGTGDCGAEGTCATCAVAVTKGAELLSPLGTQEEQIFRNKPRWRMSCKAIVGHGMQEGDITVRLSPRQWEN